MKDSRKTWCLATIVAALCVAIAGSAQAKVVDLGVGGYVADCLVANWDGICNVSADQFHDPTAAKWTDLVSGRTLKFVAVPSHTVSLSLPLQEPARFTW